MLVDAILVDPVSYTLTPSIGATTTVSSVDVGTMGSFGATSVIITHSGTTLGGTYLLVVIGPTDLSGNAIDSLYPTNRVTVLTLGDTPTVTAAATAGNMVQLTFSDEMLTETDFSPGMEDTTAYDIASSYPVPVVVQSATHPAGGDAAKVDLEVQGMTSVSYTTTVGPATAIDYDGTYLPSASTEFVGTSVGTGTSSVGVSGILLTKVGGVTYGWQFEDQTGKLVADCSFRVDLVINAASAVYDPPLLDAVLGAFWVSDGAIQVGITLNRVAGIDTLDVTSGAYNASVPASWSSGASTITLLRNEKAGHCALLFNGVVLISALSAGFTGVPSIPPGVRFFLDTSYGVTQFPVTSLMITATQTLFSGSWNFVHNGTTVFVGSSALTRDHLFTRYGPLVKDWGDATPATEQDVAVRINGTDVDIDSVNPYTGQITLGIPIPLTPPGTVTVDTDYKWFANPLMGFAKLNTLGLVLNKWDRATGHTHPSVSPSPPGHYGVPDEARFPMGLAIQPVDRPQPIQIGHRFIGFEQAYTAALNSPTTMLLNQNNHRVSVPYLEDIPDGVSVAFEGTSDPSLTWTLNGDASGSTINSDGTYTLIDASSGYTGEETAAVYSQEINVSNPSAVILAGRGEVLSTTSDGVFSGVGFGMHDNRRLYLLGFLSINNVQHIGMLQDATRPDLTASWSLGASLPIQITSEDMFVITSASFSLSSVPAGTRIQILSGVQAGIYTIATVSIADNGDATFTIDTAFPVSHRTFAGATATAVFETVWDSDLITYRMVVNTEDHVAQVLVGGLIAGTMLSLNDVSAMPEQTSLLLPTGDEGATFWGSLSRSAANSAKWSFFRYGVTPDQVRFSSRGIVVAAEMESLPENDSNHEWFITSPFGYSDIVGGNTLLLKSTAASTEGALDLTFGYERIEPFFSQQAYIDFDAVFRVDSGVLGAGDAQIRIKNTDRDVLLATLLYMEGGSPYRRLLFLPSVSITGMHNPTLEGWEESVGSDLTTTVRGKNLILVGKAGVFSKTLALTGDATGGRIIESRFVVVNSESITDTAAPVIGADVGLGAAARRVQIALRAAPEEIVLSSGGADVGTFAFAWNDAAPHSYRLVCDPTTATVSVLADNVLLGLVDLTLFSLSITDDVCFFGADSDASATVEWASASVSELPPIAAKRTLGVLKNIIDGDPDNIDSWEIPRTDSSSFLNSSSSAVVEEMDWRSNIQIRVRLDPSWGCTVFRPDLVPPPYFSGDFATQLTEPSAGWINVEYRDLPQDDSLFGTVAFGAMDPRSITQHVWNSVRYHIYGHSSEEFIASHHMVLNQCNVITSGELGKDITVEQVDVESLSSTLVSLIPADINADRVFRVMVGGSILATSSWTFDKSSQSIFLASALPTDHTMVTVIFAPGRPVTGTYLEGQPLSESGTLLNDSTPPFQKSQVGVAIRQIVFGTQINDPTDTLDNDPDFILNNAYRSVIFEDDPSVLYENMQFFELDNGGQSGIIAIASDGPAPEEGFAGITVSGDMFTDQPRSASSIDPPFSQATYLLASGGGYIGGHLGPGTAVLWPNKVIRQISLNMRFSSVVTDATADPPTEQDLEETGVLAMSDATPPSQSPGVEPNPDGASFVDGAAYAYMDDGGIITTTVLHN